MKVEIMPPAMTDLQQLPTKITAQIFRKIERLRSGLVGDIKRLHGHECDYRLRCGDHRVLFDVVEDVVKIRRVLHRSQAYD